MRKIDKHKEPPCLTLHRKQPHSNFDNIPVDCKLVLREFLVKEQRGLCCFCMCRITPEAYLMKIAHMHPQTIYPEEALDYRNLFGVCLGGEGKPLKQQHCDTAQGNTVLSFNLIDQRIEEIISYLIDGRISSSIPQVNHDLNDVLNLNLPLLQATRKAVLDSFRKAIPSGKVRRGWLERKLREWNGEGHQSELEPYCQVVVYYIRKKLRQL